MAGRKKINWLQVRTAYVVRGWSATRCAEEFNLHPTTVKTKASAEGWTTERDRLQTNATEAATDAIKAGSIDAINAIREDHAQIVSRMHSILDGIDEDIQAAKVGRTRIETRKLAAEAFSLVLRGSRLVLGITEGMSSVDSRTKDDNRIHIEIVEPVEKRSESA